MTVCWRRLAPKYRNSPLQSATCNCSCSTTRQLRLAPVVLSRQSSCMSQLEGQPRILWTGEFRSELEFQCATDRNVPVAMPKDRSVCTSFAGQRGLVPTPLAMCDALRLPACCRSELGSDAKAWCVETSKATKLHQASCEDPGR